MAKQKGSNPITGMIDGFSFYYNKEYGYLLRRAGAPTRKALKKGSNFDITRRNNEEFGRASHYGKLIRHGFRVLTKHCSDSDMHHRLSSRLRDILKMDKESVFGKRDLRKDSLSAFHHFEWDQWSLSNQYFDLPAETRVKKGYLDVTAAINLKRKPPGAAAWKLHSITVTIDFINKAVKVNEQESDVYEFEKGCFAESFTHDISEAGVLFNGMCIEWFAYDATIDDYKPLKQRHVNAGFIRYVE